MQNRNSISQRALHLRNEISHPFDNVKEYNIDKQMNWFIEIYDVRILARKDEFHIKI